MEKLARKLPSNRPQKPAGYSFLTKKCSETERVRITRYLSACRDGVIQDLGGEEALSAAKLILVDRLVSLLGVIRGIESYHQDDILTAQGELKPALGKNYLSYVNSTRLILCALGLEKIPKGPASLEDVIAQFDAKAQDDGAAKVGQAEQDAETAE